MHKKLRDFANTWTRCASRLSQKSKSLHLHKLALAILAGAAMWGFSQSFTGEENLTAQEGGPTHTPSISGQAYELNGLNQAVKTRIDTNPENHPVMTWSAWVLPRKLAGKRQILSSDNGGYKRSLLIENSRFVIFTGGTSWSTPEAAEAGVWQHVTVVFEPDAIRFYKNGVEHLHRPPMPNTDPVQPLAIGKNPSFGEHFAGLIDEVQIEDRALSEKEILANYEKFRASAEAFAKEELDNSVIYDPEAGNIKGPELEIVEADAATQAKWAQEETEKQAQEEAFRAKELAWAQAHQNARLTALDALSTKWDLPQSFPDKRDAWKIEDHDNKKKKDRSADYLGKVTLLLFLDGEDVQSEILQEANALQKEGLEIVVLTPARPKKPEIGQKEASVEEGLRALLPQIPEKATILSDPYGSVRYQLGLFSTPAVLFDKKGRIIWKTRIGQRESGDDTEEFRKATKLALENKILEEKPSRKSNPFTPSNPKETELFGFENGWEGWTLEGDAWNPEDETIQGPSNERHIPGLVAGFLGRHWISSFAGKFSGGVGTATSPEFEITAPYLHFLAGGGDIAQNAGLALEVEGKYVRNFSPSESTYELKPAVWDLTPFLGKKGRIIAYDSGTKEMRDGIMADAFTLSNSPETPKVFAERHDPNETTHVARVAADYPETWKRLQAGEFYQKSIPRWTFEIERVVDAKPLPNAGNTLIFEHIAISEETPVQKAFNQKLEIGVDGIKGRSENIPLKKAIYAKEMLTAENKRKPKESLQVIMSAYISITEQEMNMGENPDYQPATKEQIAANARLPITKEALTLFKNEKILRLTQETDRTYILRVWRYLQRYYIGSSVWGGWPTSKEMKEDAYGMQLGGLDPKITADKTLKENLHGLETPTPKWGEWLITKSIDCPGAGLFAILSQLARIPTLAGQGSWANKEIGGESVGHVRALVFLEGCGWLLLDDDKHVSSRYGQFTAGTKTGDNYFQYVDEKIDYAHKGNIICSDPFITWKTKSVVPFEMGTPTKE